MNQIGIYSITCTKNGRKYIGQSRVLNKRKWQHFNELKHNKHHNKYLQNTYNKYSLDNFKFEVIEHCGVEELNEKEAYWINYYNSNDIKLGYNQKEIAHLLPCSKEHSENCKKATSKRNTDKYGLWNLFNLHTGEVTQVDSRKEYGMENKTYNYKRHYLALRDGFTLDEFKKYYEGYNYYQLCQNGDGSTEGKKIYAKNLTTGEVLEFPSVCRGAKELGIHEGLVRNVVLGRKLSTNNYTFSKTTEFPEQADRSCIPVFVLDKEGCRYYDSQYTAASLEFPTDKHASSYIKDFIDTDRSHKGCKFFSTQPTEVDKTILQYNLTAQEASAYRIVYENKTIAPKDLPATNKSNRVRLKKQLIQKNLITQCPTTFTISLT